MVREIDGKDAGFNPGDVHVHPGIRTVKNQSGTLAGLLRNDDGERHCKSLRRSGPYYMVDGRIYRFGERVWIGIVDEETGEIVAGIKPYFISVRYIASQFIYINTQTLRPK